MPLFSQQLGKDARMTSRIAAQGSQQSVFEALPLPDEHLIRKRIVTSPAWEKQLSRRQAVVGKFLNGSRADAEEARMYVPDYSVKAGTHSLQGISFDRNLGREKSMNGSRLAASSPVLSGKSISIEAFLAAERLTRPTGARPIRMAKQLPRSKPADELQAGRATDFDEGVVRDTVTSLAITRPRAHLGAHDFSRTIGRTDGAHSGSRLAANLLVNTSHWRPTKPPNLEQTRPRTSGTGVAWEKQIDRQQAVVGKLLEDFAMNKFLNGAGSQGGADFYNINDQLLRRSLTVPDLSKQCDRMTAVTGKLLADPAFAALVRVSNSSAPLELSSASRRSAVRRRARGDEKREGSMLSSGSHSMARPNSSPSIESSAQDTSSSAHVRRFEEQIGRVPWHQAGVRDSPAPAAGAKARTDLLSPQADHLFR